MDRRNAGGVVRLPVRTRRQLVGAGEAQVESLIFCPLLARSLPVDLCGQCTRVESAGTESFSCRIELPRDDGRPRVDVAEAAARTYVGEVMGRDSVVVRDDAPVEVAVDLIQQGASCVAVVGATGGLVGVVRPRALLRELRSGRRFVTVAEAAEVTDETLGEALPLSMAMAVLADSGDSGLPVLSDAGAVVGSLSASDVVRWVAGRMGYAVE